MKEVVLPFNKFPGVDPLLGPEMRSTGEVMGVGRTFAEAFAKAQPVSYTHLDVYKRQRPHSTGEGAIISLPGCHQVNTESRHNRIVFTDIVRRLS